MKESKIKLYRTDEKECVLRFRALDAAAVYTNLENFNVYTAGYLQALKDMKVEEEYVETFKNLVKRVRKSYARVVEK